MEIATVVEGEAFIDAYIATLNGGATPVAVISPSRCRDHGGTRMLRDARPPSPAARRCWCSTSPSAAAAVGTIEQGRTDAEIEAFLATSPTGPPPWFTLSALLETGDGPASTLVELHPGDLTVVCLGLGAEGPRVTGRAALRVG